MQVILQCTDNYDQLHEGSYDKVEQPYNFWFNYISQIIDLEGLGLGTFSPSKQDTVDLAILKQSRVSATFNLLLNLMLHLESAFFLQENNFSSLYFFI